MVDSCGSAQASYKRIVELIETTSLYELGVALTNKRWLYSAIYRNFRAAYKLQLSRGRRKTESSPISARHL